MTAVAPFDTFGLASQIILVGMLALVLIVWLVAFTRLPFTDSRGRSRRRRHDQDSASIDHDPGTGGA